MLIEIEMRRCPFCGSDDLDADFWASQKDEGGPIVTGPGCMDCDATAQTLEQWNERVESANAPFVTIMRRVGDE